ncbi:MAG: hypothetical protein PHT12_05385 [Patescibacteria group bacterium]|nr:hypothetical protein [Patescibacteria group bacterium]
MLCQNCVARFARRRRRDDLDIAARGCGCPNVAPGHAWCASCADDLGICEGCGEDLPEMAARVAACQPACPSQGRMLIAGDERVVLPSDCHLFSSAPDPTLCERCRKLLPLDDAVLAEACGHEVEGPGFVLCRGCALARRRCARCTAPLDDKPPKPS